MKHLACIMDGNRRWATKNWQAVIAGHKKGLDAVTHAIDFCLEKSIPYLSLYTLSLENLHQRPQYELNSMFKLFEDECDRIVKEGVSKNIKVRFIGDRASFPQSLQPLIAHVERETIHGNKLYLNLLFCYGARQEIVSSIKRLFADIRAGIVREEDISEELFAQHLWTHGIPEPDLIIRTGGVFRLSNFLLFQAAYSEFYFLDCLWPDISRQHFDNAWEFFTSCKRNFGT